MIYFKDANFDNDMHILYSDCPSFSGILAGVCKGDVWVDHVQRPTLALVYSQAVGGFSILGEPENDSVFEHLHKFLTKNLFLELKLKGDKCFEFSAESKRTEEQLLKLFKDKEMSCEDEYTYRRNFTCNINEINPYKIIKVDSEFIRQMKAGKFNDNTILDKIILESWGTYDEFLSKSLAYVAVYEDYIAAVIAGTARYQNIIPIDIETDEKHRRKGLASAITQYFVNDCVGKGIVAQWDCVDSNAASKKTALKVGFELHRKRQIYWFEM